MKTIILDKPGQLRLTETDAPTTHAPADALVRVRRIGVCGTDLHAFRGVQPFFSYPRILGHELGVEVVAIGTNPQGIKPGDRCCVRPHMECGTCIACRRGRPNCCTKMNVIGVHSDGGMRELITVPVDKLYKSEKLSLEQLALVETLCIGAHAVERAKIEPGEFALVIGAGPIGLSAVQFAQVAGAKVIVMDISEGRLAFCEKNLGVKYVVDARGDALAEVARITGGDLPTVVFEATGNAASMMKSLDYVAHSGRLVYISLVQADITFHDPLFHRREMTMLSSRNALPADFARVIRLIEAGKVDTTPWITHRANIADAAGLFPDWLKPESRVIKAVIEA
jgi:2-desacetyl-2-hydroxyethyl bacteriochlorophyllide A dehydrogenase